MFFKTNRSAQHARFALQPALIRKHFPFLRCEFKGAELLCSGEITPSNFCDTYQVSIRYPKGKVPRVRILRPKIEPSTKIHMYPNGTLCLYDHRSAPWSANYDLHQTIIPWTAEWLVFYELYKTHGVWLGPEAPHGDDESKEPQNEAA